MASASYFKISLLLFLLHFISVVKSEDTFIRPMAGEVIPVNEPYTIQWEADSASLVEIELWNGNDKITNITSSTPNKGSFTWTPVSFFTRDNYFLAICPLDDPSDTCGYTFNGRFSIGSSAASSSSSPSSPASTPTSSSSTSSSTGSSSSTLTPNSSSSTSQTSTPSSSTSTTSTNTPLQNSSPTPPSTSGLSTSAKIAIGLVVPIFIISASLLLFLIFRKNRKLKSLIKTANSGNMEGGSDRYQKPELPTDAARSEVHGRDRWGNRVELGGNGVYEAGSGRGGGM